jgi:pimeloyl-ACP methyl ester carboxylesterase
MGRLFIGSIACWLWLFELIATWRRWRGLSWLQWPLSAVLLLTPLVVRVWQTGKWLNHLIVLLLTAPLALLIQIAGSSVRNRALNPLLRLRPGPYNSYTITRLDITMSTGYLPALHIAPEVEYRSAVCVIHGSGCDKTYYAWRLVDTLLDEGIAVLLIDMDGHGENPRPQSFPAILDDVRVSVAWLRERYERVGVLGVSLGGCLAARAVADGVKVDRLAILEAPPLLHYTNADVWREGVALARPYLLDLFKDCTVYHLARAWEAAPIRATISTWDLIEQLDLRGSVPRITSPLLLLYGASDAIVKPSQAEEVRQIMPEGTRFQLVPGASHLTLMLTPQALRTLGEWFGALNKE